MDTTDLVKLLQAIQVNNVKLSKQLNENSEQLSREIKESKTDIQKELTNITKNIEAIKADTARIDAKNEVDSKLLRKDLMLLRRMIILKERGRILTIQPAGRLMDSQKIFKIV